MTGTVPISVVVPTVDRPQELARCLDAVLSGTVLPAEVVVVDQGADDSVGEVLAARAGPGVPLVHLRRPRRGLSAARNEGLAVVQAPWVAFTDDDCVPGPTWLEAISRRAGAPDRVDGIGGRVLPLGAPRPDRHTLSLRLSRRPATFSGRALPWVVGSGGNTSLRTAALRAAGGYDERLGSGSPGRAGEDLEVLHRLLRAGARLAYDPDVVVGHGRVSGERRLATRRSYGFGMGAFTALWVRQDPWVTLAAGRWIVDRVLATARAARSRDRWRLREERLLVAGLLGGLRYGWRLGSPLTAAPLSPPPPPPPPPPPGQYVGVDDEQL